MRLVNKDKAITIANYILNTVPKLISNISIVESTNELKILTNKENLNNLLIFLKTHSFLQFKSLQDVFAVDYLDYVYSSSLQLENGLIFNKKERFQINYYVLSIINEVRCLIKINNCENTSIDSVSNIYNSACWLEREIWDMFGLYFKNHPDLRRILSDYGFEGYALRKDFPLSGFTEVSYTTELKKITLKPLELTQEYRVFDFVSPWDIKK